MRLLVDGDIIAYQAAAVAETPINWGDGLWTLHSYESDVERLVTDAMEKLIEDAGVTSLVTAISHSNNFRKTVDETYKGNRKNTRKPMLLDHAKAFLFDKYEGVVWENLEADDVLGILGSGDSEAVIWSKDKDLKTIPCKHLMDGEVIQIDEAEANYWFFYQTLVGDSTDGYPGCPKVGPKTAEKILTKDCSWDSVVEAYKKAGLGEDYALTQARLARILRDGEYDLRTGEVTLWNP